MSDSLGTARELKISCCLIPHTREWAPTCLVNFCVEFGPNALACHDQLGIVQFGGQRFSNVIANLHIRIPIKPGDAVLLNVLQRIIDRSESDLDFLTPALDLSGS